MINKCSAYCHPALGQHTFLTHVNQPLNEVIRKPHQGQVIDDSTCIPVGTEILCIRMEDAVEVPKSEDPKFPFPVLVTVQIADDRTPWKK